MNDLQLMHEVVKLALTAGEAILPFWRADVAVTNRIAEAGRLLGILVHDHVIVGKEGHVSLKARGLV